MDIKKIEKGVRLIIEGIGEDPDRPGLKRTPQRLAEMYGEIFSGIAADTNKLIVPMAGESHDEMVLIRDIPFYSVCEHHLLPFFGRAHIAYIPGAGKIVGISALARALEVLAKRPQVQERLTAQFADLIVGRLKPKGAMVVIDAEHLCMSMRGVKKPGSHVVTSAVRGTFRTKESTRTEMLALLREHA
ncbi:MAG TPA: GTP cyclohydrolase I FolE [Nitrospirota bacterium]|nr:GTP cyclohydrolase I FolE [Nitrospirota bacterium]